MKHTNIRSFIRARVNYNKILSVSLSVIIVISLFTSPAFANVSVNTGSAPLQPQVSGSFPVSAENAGSYVEPANTFSDGSPTYYLVTQDASKAAWTSVTYDGVDYTLAAAGGVKVTNDIKTIGAIFAANTTIFFDSGTYNDADETAYTRFSADNLSLVGLYGASSTSITKSAHATDGTIERNIIYARNIYMQGITFDGLGRNMCQAAAGSGYGKNRGEYYFYISGKEAPWTSSDNFVMKDCVIQNIGSNNSSSAKNLAINIYSSSGKHNFENLIIRNTKTASNLGIVSSNDSTNNYFKNLTIDGSAAASAYSIKLETNTPTAAPYNTCNNVFTGSLNLTQSGNLGCVYIQEYRYANTVLPADYRYARYSTLNGYFGGSAVNVYASVPDPINNQFDFARFQSWSTAVLDLKDNYWIVQSGKTVSVENQLKNTNTVINSVTSAGITVPGTNIKLSSAAGVLPSFGVPNMSGGSRVNIVAVAAASDSYNSAAQIPLSAGAAVTLPAVNASLVKFYNIDFDQNAKYTLQEAISGINPALVTTTDPNESGTIPGYPKYSGYATAAAAKVTNSSVSNFENCRFSSLIREIELTSAPGKVLVGNSTQLAARIKDSNTNSFTGAAFSGNIRDTANDQTINWFSSDPSIISVDKVTGLASAHSIGTVTITAKAMDVNNNGEIEKPFASFSMESETSVTLHKTDSTTADGIQGAEITIYNNVGSAVSTTATGADGTTTILGLPAGAYTFKETAAPAGYVINTSEFSFAIASDGTITGDNTVTDAKTTVTLNKTDTATSVGIPGAEITIYNAAGKAVSTTLTGADGKTTIQGLPVGTYTFRETGAPIGYILNPAYFSFEIASDGTVSGSATVSDARTSVTLTKTDANTSAGIAGAEITVYNTEGTAVSTTITGAGGSTVIQGLPVGTYTFKETSAPAGYVLNPEAFTFTITASGSILGITTVTDTRMSVRLGDIVWDDINKNGIQDIGEAGIPGVVLTISGPNGSVVKNIADVDVSPATTDSSGMYIFYGLPILAADQSYTVTIDQGASAAALAGYTSTIEGAGIDRGLDSSSNSAVSAADLTFDGANDLTLDFGFYKPGSISGQVWLDSNRNGIRDADETYLSGIAVQLFDGADNFLATIGTSSSGSYQFTDLAAGTYYIRVFTPPDSAVTAQDQGSDESVDSDISVVSGQADLLTLSAGNNITHLDAGVFYGSINGTIVLDADKSGNISTGDSPLALYTVTLQNTSTGSMWTTLTDVLGVYRFTGLPLGSGTRYVLSVSAPDGTVIQFAPSVGQSLTRTSPELITQNFGFVPVAAPTAAPTPPSDVLGTNRTPTVTPTVTPTPTPATGVLGAAKTGETAGISAFPSVLILLSAAALLVLYEKRRRYGKNEKGEAK